MSRPVLIRLRRPSRALLKGMRPFQRADGSTPGISLKLRGENLDTESRLPVQCLRSEVELLEREREDAARERKI